MSMEKFYVSRDRHIDFRSLKHATWSNASYGLFTT